MFKLKFKAPLKNQVAAAQNVGWIPVCARQHCKWPCQKFKR